MTEKIKQGYFVEKIKNFLINKKNWDPKSFEDILNNSIEIYKQFEPTKTKNTGIMIGKIQSGKTSNFTSLIALAFDNDFDIAIVLGGTKDDLNDQTNDWLNQAFDTSDYKCKILDTKKNLASLKKDYLQACFADNQKIIITSLKNSQINKITKVFQNHDFKDKLCLIIDDEGDQASLNTNVYSRKKLYPSTTYRQIDELRSVLKGQHTFVSVTASPQANLLIEAFDTLHPTFGKLIYPGDKYVGLAHFHSSPNQDKQIIVIPDEDYDILKPDSGLPSSFVQALSFFFVSNAIRRSRNDLRVHSILFHPSRLTIEHEVVEAKLNNLLAEWKTRANDTEDTSFEPLKEELLKAYEIYKNDGVHVPPFEKLLPTMIQCIKACPPVITLNNATKATIKGSSNRTNIYLGGNKLERGLVVEGLAITHIIRRAKSKSNIDTEEQRARWFGYKKDYFDVCRVFTTNRIKKDYHEIYLHDDALWECIQTNLDAGVPFANIPNIFYNDDPEMLRLTRTNVARSKNLRVGIRIEQKAIYLSESEQIKNIELLDKFKKTTYKKSQILTYTNTNKHQMFENVNYSEVYKKIFTKFIFSQKSGFSNDYFKKLKEIFNYYQIDPKVDLIFMRYKSYQDGDIGYRSIDQDGIIQTALVAGPSPTYRGDANVNAEKKYSSMQIQVHMIKPSDREDIKYYSPCFSIGFTPDLINKISSWVERKEKQDK